MSDEAVFAKVCEIAREKELITADTDLMIATSGIPYGTPGAANVIRVISGDAGRPHESQIE